MRFVWFGGVRRRAGAAVRTLYSRANGLPRPYDGI